MKTNYSSSLVANVALAAAILFATPTAHAQTFTTLRSFGNLTNKLGSDLYAPLVQGADGSLYGTTSHIAGIMRGSIFRLNPDGSGFALLKQFTNVLDGAAPKSSLLLSGNTLYGTTTAGGSENGGTVFKINTDGTGFAVLKTLPTGSYNQNLPTIDDFDARDVERKPPMGGLAVSGTTLYGTTRSGGSAARGTVFQVNTDGSAYSVIKEFSGADGAAPTGDLVLSGTALFGTTSSGGGSSTGTVFTVNINGAGFSVLKHFTGSTTDGAQPFAGLVLAGSTLFGTTFRGGTLIDQAGTVFKLNTDGSGFSLLKSFGGGSGGSGPIDRLALSGDMLYGTTTFDGRSVFKLNTNGNSFVVVLQYPARAGLVVSGNTLYGTNDGEVFKVNTDGGGFAVLKSFPGGSGDPGANGGLVLSDGMLYGAGGGVFKLNTNGGGYTVLHQFTGESDGFPNGRVVVSGNTIYGTTYQYDVANNNYGTLYKVNTDGSDYTVLRRLGQAANDGNFPLSGMVLSGSTLYGTAASGGGPSGGGAVFRINTDGSNYQNLHSFSNGADGAQPEGELTLIGNTLYGVNTFSALFTAPGKLFKLGVNGTGFTVLHSFTFAFQSSNQRLTPVGNTLYGVGVALDAGEYFSSVYKINTDGSGFQVVARLPDSLAKVGINGGLTWTGSELLGAASGEPGFEMLFKVNTNGTGYHVLKNLGPFDGVNPLGDLALVGTTVYGTARFGGDLDEGTAFSFDLRPRLTIIRSGATAALTWPTHAFGFALQSTTNLVSPVVWSTGSPAPVVVNGQNTVTNPVSGPQRMYRLSQ